MQFVILKWKIEIAIIYCIGKISMLITKDPFYQQRIFFLFVYIHLPQNEEKNLKNNIEMRNVNWKRDQK